MSIEGSIDKLGILRSLPKIINMAQTKIIESNISELIPDDSNFNRGTEYGGHLMDKSFRKFGCGRSILLDKHNRVIAGNKSLQTYADIGMENVRIIETTGDELIAVKRTDIDLNTKKGREMALADNATSNANLDWDEGNIASAIASFEIDTTEWGVDLEFDAPAEDNKGENEEEQTSYIKIKCQKGDSLEIGEYRFDSGDTIDIDSLRMIIENSRYGRDRKT